MYCTVMRPQWHATGAVSRLVHSSLSDSLSQVPSVVTSIVFTTIFMAVHQITLPLESLCTLQFEQSSLCLTWAASPDLSNPYTQTPFNNMPPASLTANTSQSFPALCSQHTTRLFFGSTKKFPMATQSLYLRVSL